MKTTVSNHKYRTQQQAQMQTPAHNQINNNTNQMAPTAGTAPTGPVDMNAMLTELVQASIHQVKPAIKKAAETAARQAMSNVQASIDNQTNRIVNNAYDEIKNQLISEFGLIPQPIVVKSNRGEHAVKASIVHNQYDKILGCVNNNIPVYLYGPTGSGKSLLAKQVADGLGFDFYVMNSVTDEFKLTGFMDANGHYNSTQFREAFEHGGVFLLDEIDASAPDVLITINMAISQREFAFPDKRVKAHPDFRVIATGNTIGRGADSSYRGRTQLDAASLDRFVMIPVDYDERIDKQLVGKHTDLLEFVKAYRRAITASSVVNVTCSHRKVSQMATLVEFMDVMSVLDSCLLTGLDSDDIRAISHAMSNDKSVNLDNNQWYKVFSAIAAA